MCVESRARLGELAGADLTDLDPHRPYIDDVVIGCPTCAAPARRVPQVIDAWFDSGSMPFAQWGYPHRPGSGERFAGTYPADFICEGIDQTRGWFYTLMAVGTLVFQRSAYRNVLCLGIILAEDGRRMSTRLGNTLPPLPLMDQHGADAVRWFMAAAGSPWAARRVGHQTINEAVRRVFLTYWNTVSFQVLYGGVADWTPSDADPALRQRPVLDRWLASPHRRARRHGDGRTRATSTRWAPATPSPPTPTICPTGTSGDPGRRFWNGRRSSAALPCTTPSTL